MAPTPGESQINQRTALITDGVIDDQHLAVVLLASYSEAGTIWCTAVIIGTHTALTAAHCVEGATAEQLWLADQRLDVLHVTTHPGWDATRPLQSIDLAVLELAASPGVAVTPLAWASPFVGQPLTIVGYGTTTEGGASDFQRRTASNVISDIDNELIYLDGTGGGHGNTCEGDSGGAVLLEADGAVYLGAIITGGLPPCGSTGWAARLDTQRDWLLSASGGDVAELGIGDPCGDSASCASGRCASAAQNSDPMCTRECQLDTPSCPVGWACVEAAQGGHVCWPGTQYESQRDQAMVVSGGCAMGGGSVHHSNARGILLALTWLLLAVSYHRLRRRNTRRPRGARIPSVCSLGRGEPAVAQRTDDCQ